MPVTISSTGVTVPTPCRYAPTNYNTDLSLSWETDVLGRLGFIIAPSYGNHLVHTQNNLALVSKNDFILLTISIPSDITPTPVYTFLTVTFTFTTRV